MAMDAILGGKVLINGTDIWKVYGASWWRRNVATGTT